jgi:hypothetical protein
MDYFAFILIILILIILVVILNRSQTKTRDKYKIDAYRLLETPEPSAKEVRDTIKALKLYSGRWFKDKESVELVKRLQNKLGQLTG